VLKGVTRAYHSSINFSRSSTNEGHLSLCEYETSTLWHETLDSRDVLTSYT
jgi:hypothetical protein